MIIHLIVTLIKKTLIKMSQYFPKKRFERNINVKFDLSNYATEIYLIIYLFKFKN